MDASSSKTYHLDKRREYTTADISLRDSSGAVVLYIELDARQAKDGTIRAQLELRFEDKPSALVSHRAWLEGPGYEIGRKRVMVALEPRDSLSPPMRFSIYIPSQAGADSDGAWNAKVATSRYSSKGAAIREMRERCRHSGDCRYPVCILAEDRVCGELADDLGWPIVGSLPPLSHDSQNIDPR